jgi:hypothetical protein
VAHDRVGDLLTWALARIGVEPLFVPGLEGAG